ncbi:MAG: hypothetical protein LIP03_12925 [Bacteroidales bacterium]|nr:hypothetical protein [Bacteroidales bacterium]
MRKLFLLTAALLTLGWAKAETVTWTPSEQGYENAETVAEATVDNAITLTFEAGSNSNAPKYYTTGTALRLYGGNTMTVTCDGTLTEVVFTTGSSNTVNAESTVSVGELAIDGSTATWTGEASSFTFTQGGSSGHVRIESLTFTYEESTPVADLNYKAQGLISTLDSWGENYIPKGNAQIESYDGYVIVKAWAGVEGYDLRVDYDTSYAVTGLACLLNGEEYTSGTSGGVYLYTGLDDYYCFYAYVESGYGYCYDMGEGNSSYLALSGYFYDADNVTYEGCYYFEWPAETYVAPLPTVDNLNALSDFENGAEFTITTDLTVIYANGSYVYVTDGTSNGLIYKSGLGLEAGNIIAAGWDAKLSIYKNLPEIVPSVDLTVSGDAEELPAATPVETADIPLSVAANNLCAYLDLQGVEFTEVTPASGSFTGLAGETEVTFYNTFKLESQVAGIYNVTGFVSIYNETVQFLPVAYELVKETPVLQFTAQGAVINNNQGSWSSYVNMIPACNVSVECYSANTIIIPAVAGVEGYGMKVEFDDDNYITAITPIVNGVEGETVTKGYAGVYTGLDDYYYMYIYVGTGYGYAYNTESGYVMNITYFCDVNNNQISGAYYVEWPAPTVVDNLNAIIDFADDEEFIVGAPLTVLYANGAYNYVTDGIVNALVYAEDLGLNAGDVLKTGWKANIGDLDGGQVVVPAQTLTALSTVDVPAPTPVEAADASMMIAAYNRNAYLCLENIVFEEATPVDSLFTGLANGVEIKFNNIFNVASVSPGAYDVTGFVAADSTQVVFLPTSIYYHVNYEAQGFVTTYTSWGKNRIPKTNAQVESCDGFIIIKAWAGVEGYDVKIAYDADNAITGITPIVDGVEGEEVTSGYANCYTGLEDYYCFSAYVGPGRGYLYDQGEGNASYALQSGYFYDADGYKYGAYYIEWPAEDYVAPETVDNLNALTDFEDGSDFIYGAQLTVLYANGEVQYVTDGVTNAMMVSDNALVAGNVISTLWEGVVVELYNQQALVPAEELETEAELAEVPDATPVEADDAEMMVALYNVNAYLCIEKVEIAENIAATGEFAVAVGEGSIVLDNRFALEIEANRYYVTGFVGSNGTSAVFVPVAVVADPATGIDGIGLDSDNDEIYYNLQGIRVQNPAAGKVYIRVANGKAERIVK